MRVKYIICSLHNPLFPRPISRFAVHRAAFSESATNSHNADRHNLNSSIHFNTCCRLSDFCLAFPPLARKDHLDPKSPRREPTILSSSTPMDTPTKKGS